MTEDNALNQIVLAIPYDGSPAAHYEEALKLALSEMTPSQRAAVVKNFKESHE